MPHIDINMFPGRPEDLKKKVADAVVDTMMKELGCPKEALSVAVHEVAPENWNEYAETINKDDLYAGKVFEQK